MLSILKNIFDKIIFGCTQILVKRPQEYFYKFKKQLDDKLTKSLEDLEQFNKRMYFDELKVVKERKKILDERKKLLDEHSSVLKDLSAVVHERMNQVDERVNQVNDLEIQINERENQMNERMTEMRRECEEIIEKNLYKNVVIIQCFFRVSLSKKKAYDLRSIPDNLFDTEFSSSRKKILNIDDSCFN